MRARIIPVLSFIDGNLVKTLLYDKPRYLGDPINAVKIFNGKSVDELILLDIRSTIKNTPINFPLLKSISTEAFMPLAYGGGIKSFDDAKEIFKIGYEKIILSSVLFTDSELVKKCVHHAGSQSIVGSIDIKKNSRGFYDVYINSGKNKISSDLNIYLKYVESLGVGEIIINFIDRDGEMRGYDLDLIKQVSSLLKIPMIPCGGAGKLNDFQLAIDSGAHGVAASSFFVFYGKNKAILITYPTNEILEKSIF
jgi:cyclase